MGNRGLGLWDLHERARAGHLSVAERSDYRFLLDEFLRMMADAQEAGLLVRRGPRATPRVRRAVQADLEWSGGAVRTVTFDLGLGGFSALLPAPPPADAPIAFSLRLARGHHAGGAARVVSTRKRGSAVRSSFAIETLRAGAPALEAYVVDSLLADLLPGNPILEEIAGLFGDPRRGTAPMFALPAA